MQPIHDEMLNRMKTEMENNMDPAKLIDRLIEAQSLPHAGGIDPRSLDRERL